MNTLQYLKKRYPSGKLKASYNHLEYNERLTREQCLQLRQHRRDGYVSIEDLAELLDQI